MAMSSLSLQPLEHTPIESERDTNALLEVLSSGPSQAQAETRNGAVEHAERDVDGSHGLSTTRADPVCEE